MQHLSSPTRVSNSGPLQWKSRVSTSGPPGKSVSLLLGSFCPWGSAPTSVLNLVGDLASWIHRTAPSISGLGRSVVSLSVTPVPSLAALCKSSSYMFCVCATFCLMFSDQSSSSLISLAVSNLFIKFIALNCYYEKKIVIMRCNLDPGKYVQHICVVCLQLRQTSV